MKKIEVLGTGCSSCKALHAVVLDAVKEMSLDVEVEKVEDMMRIINYGVMTLPALVVDGRVVAKGKMGLKEVKEVLTQNN